MSSIVRDWVDILLTVAIISMILASSNLSWNLKTLELRYVASMDEFRLIRFSHYAVLSILDW